MAIWKYIAAFASANKGLVIAYALFAAAGTAVTVFGLTKVSALLNERVASSSKSAMIVLGSLAALTVAYHLCNLAAGYAESTMSPLFYSSTVDVAMREVVDANQYGQVGLLDVHPLDYQGYIDVTAESSLTVFCSLLRSYIPNLLLAVAAVAYFTYLDYRYGLIFAAGSAVLVACCFLSKNSIYKSTLESEARRSDAETYSFDVLSCLNSVVAKSKGTDECNVAKNKGQQAAEARIQLNTKLNFLNYGLLMLVSVTGFVVAAMAVSGLQTTSTTTTSTSSSSSTSVLVILALVAMLQTRLNALSNTNITVVREVGRNAVHARVLPSVEIVVVDESRRSELDASLSGNLYVEFDNVTYSYPGAERPSVQDFAWQLSPGINVLQAPSGYGKTTLACLLMRLARPDSGLIRINNINIQDIPHDILRKHICFTSQHMGVLDRSLRDILLYGNDSHSVQQEVEAVWQHIKPAFPNLTLDDTTGMQGKRMSTGQKQLLRIGNVLLSEVNLVVVDEPCSGLDATLKALVMQLLQALAKLSTDGKQRTVWIITHDEDVVALADNLKQATPSTQDTQVVV